MFVNNNHHNNVSVELLSTDRILWKERKGDTVKCDHYNAVTELRSSDHLPVWAAFRVPIKPGRDT